jgi:hypothetical protein
MAIPGMTGSLLGLGDRAVGQTIAVVEMFDPGCRGSVHMIERRVESIS